MSPNACLLDGNLSYKGFAFSVRLLWFSPSRKLSTTELLAHSSQVDERIGKVKV